MNQIKIKDNPELRHFLRHMMYAVEELALGHKGACLYELAQIEEFVSWGENDEKFRQFTERRWGKSAKEKRRKKKEMSVKKRTSGGNPAPRSS